MARFNLAYLQEMPLLLG